MIEWVTQNSWAFWLIVMLVCIGLEMLSLDLWFAMLSGGALVAVLVGLTASPFWVGVLVFGLVSLVLIFFLRPVALKHLRKPSSVRTNIDRLIGEQVTVLEPVSVQAGTAKIGGETWSARTRAGVNIPVGAPAWVTSIEGATAHLSPTPPAPEGQ